MKRLSLLFVILCLFSAASSEEVYRLKLRSGYHPEFLRIVIEGTEFVISKAVVNQKGKDILVRFPYIMFSIKQEKGRVVYKTDKDTLILSPGNFSRFKVFSLKYPSRLVIDVYLDSRPTLPFVKEPTKGKIHRIKTFTTVVIDAGHGGYDTGIKEEGYIEKNVVLDIAKKLQALINRDTARCLLTRQSDQFMSLRERIRFTNNSDTEVFLSLHIGNHDRIVLYTPVATQSYDPYIKKFLINKGPEGFKAQTQAFTSSLQKAITEDFGDDMVIIRPLPYSILSKIEAAALIIELPSFRDFNYVPELNTEIAKTIYKGLYLYEETTAY
jgi:N-acetylmuramoyl-L-alanine amidase